MTEFRERKGLGLKKISSDDIADEGNQRSGLFPRTVKYLVIAAILAGGYFLYDYQLREPLTRFWDRNAEFLQTAYPEVDVIATLSELEKSEEDAALAFETVDPVLPEPEPVRELPIQDLDISVARQFRASEFVIAAVSREIKMTGTSDYNIKKMPENIDGVVHYGLLNIPNFGLTQLVLVTGQKKTRLYVDLNHNLDMTDDGDPLEADSHAFAVILPLSMYQATGVMGLDGQYRLWIYRPEGSGTLRYYPLTQLVGKISIGEEAFDALIAETLQIDGNFLNDGIFFDWNRDGKFDNASEQVNPGQVVRLENGRFRFRLLE
jgi:hypothetical protein